MSYIFKISLIFLGITFYACSEKKKSDKTNGEETRERPVAVDNGKIYREEDRKMLWAGEDSSMHFDITGHILKDYQFHYGIGREHFPALLQPEYISAGEADEIWPDSTRFLVVYSGEEAKAYSIKDLTRHEVVNDSINGTPIMAAYCILADLGAIYDRNYGDHTLTFGVSGYTYYDKNVWNGMDGFILWDRETESLWWPLIDQAVSGSLKGVKLRKYDETHWEDTTWQSIKERFPYVQVLKSNQDFTRPEKWERVVDAEYITTNFSKN